jgi:hypothetical protein
MHYIHLILTSNFLHVLSSTRKLYTKNYYFSKHKLFSTNSLLQEQRLSLRNYSKQELIIKSFVQPTNHNVNIHAKIQFICMYRYL